MLAMACESEAGTEDIFGPCRPSSTRAKAGFGSNFASCSPGEPSARSCTDACIKYA